MPTVPFSQFSGGGTLTPVAPTGTTAPGSAIDNSKTVMSFGAPKQNPIAPGIGADTGGVLGKEIGGNTLEDFMGGVKKIGGSISDAADKFNNEGDIFGPNGGMNLLKKTGDLLEGALGTASGAVQAIFSPLSATIKTFSDHAANSPEVQAFAQSKPVAATLDLISKAVDPLKQLAESHPEVAKNIMDGLNVGLAALGEKAPGIAAEVGGKTVDHISNIIYPAVAKVNEAGGAAVEATGAALKNVGQRAIDLSSTVADNIHGKAIDTLTNLDDATKNALSRTPKKTFDAVVDTGKKALADDTIPHPLDVAGTAVEKGLPIVLSKLRDAAEVKNNVLWKTDLWTKETGPVVKNAVADLKNTLANVELDPGDVKFRDQFVKDLESLGDNPKLGDVDKKIDLLQERLYKNSGNNLIKTANKSNRLVGPLRQTLGEINNGVKELGGAQYRDAIDRVSELTQLKNKLNKDLGPETVGDETKGATNFVRRLFTTGNAKDTRQTLLALSKETGVDYIKQARVAKFVMDALGDIRSKSLLEARDIPLTMSSATMTAARKVLDWVVKKTGIADPIKAAQRFIDKNGSKSAPEAAKGAVEAPKAASVAKKAPVASQAAKSEDINAAARGIKTWDGTRPDGTRMTQAEILKAKAAKKARRGIKPSPSKPKSSDDSLPF